jgi:aminoglycoside phosphotransferase (APT) family kinase protein
VAWGAAAATASQPSAACWPPGCPAIGSTPLGELLSALHAVPVEHLAGLVDVDAQPLAAWRGEAAETYAAVAGEVPVGDRRPVEEFLEAPVSAGGWVPVCSHNDLGSSMSWSIPTPAGRPA